MYHVSEKGKLRAERLGDRAEKFASGVDSFCSVVADRGAARPGASQPVCPRRLAHIFSMQEKPCHDPLVIP